MYCGVLCCVSRRVICWVSGTLGGVLYCLDYTLWTTIMKFPAFTPSELYVAPSNLNFTGLVEPTDDIDLYISLSVTLKKK
jgi:hypothetical protein